MLVEDIDPQGKISLKPVGPEWDVPEAPRTPTGGDRRRAATASVAAAARSRGDRGGGDREPAGSASATAERAPSS